MNKYIPNTEEEQAKMLSVIGIQSADRLFDCIPQTITDKNDINIPAGLSDIQLERKMMDLAGKNKDVNEYDCYIGAGAYDRYIPAVVKNVLSRQEFKTAYTPYQPEASQGLLQAIFEYQSMICNLTGMAGANASLYDGGSALAEAVSLSVSVKRKKKVLISKSVNTRYKQVLQTYLKHKNIKLIEIPNVNGVTYINSISEQDKKNCACIVVQNPNYFGSIEDMESISQFAKRNKMHLVVSVNPISLGLLKSPGEYEADIVTGEGQGLASGLTYGGPYLGFFAVSKRLIRKMPGRIAGKTTDEDEKPGFVLTMQAREQHIRRERAGSNICSNQALNALAAAVYLTVLGKNGIKEVAKLSFNKAHYLHENLIKTGKFNKRFTAPFFMEFPLDYNGDLKKLEEACFNHKILFGYKIGREYEDMKNSLLIAVAEKRSKEDLDKYVRIAGEMT